MSLLPPICDQFSRRHRAAPADQARSTHRRPVAGTRAFRRRVAESARRSKIFGSLRRRCTARSSEPACRMPSSATLARLGVNGIEDRHDHDDVVGVMLAGRRDAGAKMLQRALDRHAVAIKQYAKAKDEQALRQLWDELMRSSDIPVHTGRSSYAAATETIVKKAFQDVHMLSHLVGAANRADIRRLRELEAEKEALTEKLNWQQRQLRDGFTSRDETIRQLNALLARHAPAEGTTPIVKVVGRCGVRRRRDVQKRDRGPEQEARAGDHAAGAARAAPERHVRHHEKDGGGIADGGRRAGRSAPRDRVARGSHRRGAAARRRRRRAGARALRPDDPVCRRPSQPNPAIEGAGRAHRRFLHHDGGIEHSSSLLPGSSAGPRAAVPDHCISHDAVATLKRLCRQLEKPYLPLRTASLATLASSLTGMATSKVGGSRMEAPAGPLAR